MNLLFGPVLEFLTANGGGDINHEESWKLGKLLQHWPDFSALLKPQRKLFDVINRQAIVVREESINNMITLQKTDKKLWTPTYSYELAFPLNDISKIIDGNTLQTWEISFQLHATKVVTFFFARIFCGKFLYRDSNQFSLKGSVSPNLLLNDHSFHHDNFKLMNFLNDNRELDSKHILHQRDYFYAH